MWGGVGRGRWRTTGYVMYCSIQPFEKTKDAGRTTRAREGGTEGWRQVPVTCPNTFRPLPSPIRRSRLPIHWRGSINASPAREYLTMRPSIHPSIRPSLVASPVDRPTWQVNDAGDTTQGLTDAREPSEDAYLNNAGVRGLCWSVCARISLINCRCSTDGRWQY